MAERSELMTTEPTTAPSTGTSLQRLPTVSAHITECPAGGFVLIVDGQIHSAHTEGWDASEAVARVMAAKFKKAFTRPEDAEDVTPRDDGARAFAQRLRPVPSEAKGPPEPAGLKVRQTVTLALVALSALAGSLIGP
jgi:hypothetical protein